MRLLPSIGLAALTLGGPFAGVAQGQRVSGNTTSQVLKLRPRTVLVGPFANISGNSGDDWLGAGIFLSLRMESAHRDP